MKLPSYKDIKDFMDNSNCNEDIERDIERKFRLFRKKNQSDDYKSSPSPPLNGNLLDLMTNR